MVHGTLSDVSRGILLRQARCLMRGGLRKISVPIFIMRNIIIIGILIIKAKSREILGVRAVLGRGFKVRELEKLLVEISIGINKEGLNLNLFLWLISSASRGNLEADFSPTGAILAYPVSHGAILAYPFLVVERIAPDSFSSGPKGAGIMSL